MVIGGGITGLSAAYRLVERSRVEAFPVEVLLAESKDRLGGVIKTFHRDGFLLEGGPDSFMTEKPSALDLCQRLGLTDQLIETNRAFRRSFVVRHGRLVSVPEGFYLLAPSRLSSFLSSPFLSVGGKARAMLESLIPPRHAGGDESVASFVRRRFGEEMFQRVAQPMISSIYGADPETLSMRATLPRFLEMEKRHGSVIRALRFAEEDSLHQKASGPRYGLFLSFREGMETLVNRLAESLSRESIFLNTQILRIRCISHLRWDLFFSDRQNMQVDAICLALPAHRTATLLQEVDRRLSDLLRTIPYGSLATLNLAYHHSDIPHPLKGFGFVVPAIERFPILGCSFSSIKFPGRAPNGKVLLRVFLSAEKGASLDCFSDEELKTRACRSLKQLLRISAPPLFTLVTRSSQAMPHYPVGHLDRAKEIEEIVRLYPGLSLAGNAYYGIGVPDCIQSGEVAADYLFTGLKNRCGKSEKVFNHASTSH